MQDYTFIRSKNFTVSEGKMTEWNEQFAENRFNLLQFEKTGSESDSNTGDLDKELLENQNNATNDSSPNNFGQIVEQNIPSNIRIALDGDGTGVSVKIKQCLVRS